MGKTDTVRQLANSLQNQTDLIEELKVGHKEAYNKKKMKSDSFHVLSSRLTLNNSSQNSKVMPGKPLPHFKDFFQSH